MTSVDTVLFDVDGTLCTYRRSSGELLDVAFERVGVEPFFDEQEYHDRFTEFADGTDDITDVREAAFSTFARESGRDPEIGREIAATYADERDHGNVAFTEGAERAIDALDDRYKLGIVTDGDPWMQSQKLEELGIADRFPVVVHGGHDAPLKPDPEPFVVALDRLGTTTDRAVHVGNSLSADIAGAHAAGLGSVWLANGEPDPNPRPDYVVDSLAELVDEPWR